MREQDPSGHQFEGDSQSKEWQRVLSGSKLDAVNLYQEIGAPLLLEPQVVRITKDSAASVRNIPQISQLIKQVQELTERRREELRLQRRSVSDRDTEHIFCRRFKFEFPHFEVLSELSIPDLMLMLHRFNVLSDPKFVMSYNMAFALAGIKPDSSGPIQISEPEVQEALHKAIKMRSNGEVRPEWLEAYFSEDASNDAYLALVQSLINSMVNVDLKEPDQAISLEEIIAYATANNLPFSPITVAQTLSALIQYEAFQKLSQENDLKLSEHKFVIDAISQLYLELALHDLRIRRNVIESCALPFTSPIVHRGRAVSGPVYGYGSQLTKIPISPHYLLTLPKVIDQYVMSIPDNLQPGVLFDRRLITRMLNEAQKLVLDQLEILGYQRNAALAATAKKTFGEDVLNNVSIADQFERTKTIDPNALTPWQVAIVRINRFVNSVADRGWIKSSQDIDTSVAQILDRYNKKRRQQSMPGAPDWRDRAASINHFGGKQNRTKKIRFKALARRGNV